MRYVEGNAFLGLYVVQINLPQEIVNPWDFAFYQFPFLIILRVDAPLYFLTTQMFAGCESLQTITHNGENLLSHYELDLIGIRPQNSDVHDVFTRVRIDTVILNYQTNFSTQFYSEFVTVQTIFYHSFLENSFYVPSIIQYFRNVKDISIGPYDIMRDFVIDLSHLPITTIRREAFVGLKVISIDLPASIVDLPLGLFETCSELQSVVIPSNIYQFSRYCFYGCSKLTFLIIGGVNLFEGTTLDLAGSKINQFAYMSFCSSFHNRENYF